MTFSKKLIVFFMIVGLLPLAAVGVMAYSQAAAALQQQAANQLISVRDMKKPEIESCFETISRQVVTLSEDRIILDARREFTQAFFGLRSNTARLSIRLGIAGALL